MGAGNVCVHGEHEGLYYIDWSNFSDQVETDDGVVEQDYDNQIMEWEDSLELFLEDFINLYPSFERCDEWISRSERAVLENKLFYIATEDNQWSMAIKLIQKEQGYYDAGNIVNLQAGLYKRYLEGMKNCLFNQFDEIGVYGGAWTSGVITKDMKQLVNL